MKRLAPLKQAIVDFKKSREYSKTLSETEIPAAQKELIAAVLAADPTGKKGIVFEDDGKEQAAFVQQNGAGEYWDAEEIIEWLRERKKGRRELWMACSSRTFDPAKWEAEIATGLIPKKVALKFKKKGDPPKPFIRFGNVKPESLR